MKINPIQCSCVVKRQNFGAKLSKYTKKWINEAKENGLDTSKMEKLMKEVYPNETIYTNIYDNNGKPGYISVGIGRSFFGMHQKETLFANYNYDPYLGAEFGPTQKVDKKFIDGITKRLEEIKRNNNDN